MVMWTKDEWESVVMTVRAREEVEFDWFSVDEDGNLGAHASFGLGPVPESVLRSQEAYSSLLALVEALPVTSDAIVVTAFKDTSDWVDYARRGLYAYDAGHSHGRYQLIAKPVQPAVAAQLASSIVNSPALGRVAASFSRTPSLELVHFRDALANPPMQQTGSARR